MEEKTKRIDFQNACAVVHSFDAGTEVKEYHAMIHVVGANLPFAEQLEAVTDAYTQLLETLPGKPQAVFKRYFLSDAANQADEVIVSDVTDCAKSIIEQAPLDGTKIALWVYLMTNVATRLTKSGLYEVSHGGFRHLWNGSAHNLAANSEYQTRLLFNEYNMQLLEEECTLKDNCVRTWLFVNDVDLNYGGVVRARNQFFFTQGLTVHTHFIASTGIGGRQQDYADRRHVLISGTASINNKGEIMYPRDVVKQTHRMWENVEALLKEADCGYDDVAEMVVYLRDVSDYAVVKSLYEERFADKPYVIVHAPVCRPGWLVEMECMAAKAQKKPDVPAF